MENIQGKLKKFTDETKNQNELQNSQFIFKRKIRLQSLQDFTFNWLHLPKPRWNKRNWRLHIDRKSVV